MSLVPRKIFNVKPHPETLPNEVFLENSDEAHYRAVGWRSKRKGNTAYDIYGNIVRTSRDFFPVFVLRDEITAAGFTLVEEAPQHVD